LTFSYQKYDMSFVIAGDRLEVGNFQITK